MCKNLHIKTRITEKRSQKEMKNAYYASILLALQEQISPNPADCFLYLLYIFVNDVNTLLVFLIFNILLIHTYILYLFMLRAILFEIYVRL